MIVGKYFKYCIFLHNVITLSHKIHILERPLRYIHSSDKCTIINENKFRMIDSHVGHLYTNCVFRFIYIDNLYICI